MKGYVTASGYMGYVGGYILFSSENDYLEYMEEESEAGLIL